MARSGGFFSLQVFAMYSAPDRRAGTRAICIGSKALSSDPLQSMARLTSRVRPMHYLPTTARTKSLEQNTVSCVLGRKP